MTNSKSFLVLLFLAAALTGQAQTPAERTMFKSFNLNGKNQILLQLPGTVEVTNWDNPTVKIEITVSLPNGNTAMLTNLADVGRYNLSAKTEGTTLVISAENLYRIIKVQGQDLKENISFQVFVPKSVPVEIFDSATASLDKK